jgi:hypothetical protein
MNTILLVQLIAAHLFSDFIFQPDSWVKDRKKNHWKSRYLYLHCCITALIAWLFTGFFYWQIPIMLFLSHLVIDMWKSYRNSGIVFFFADQALHLAVIIGLWTWLCPISAYLISDYICSLNNPAIWTYTAGAVFLTQPASIFIGLLTKKWRGLIADDHKSLANAGRWIGILERLIVFVLVINSQYEAIGLLIAAKSILRFNETKGAQQRTEYLLIGTLISMVIAISTGLFVKSMLL